MMSTKHSLTPLQVNPITGEPYLQLPAPLDNIILTPPRLSDASTIVTNMNDWEVVRWLERPPYPYLMTHAESWLMEIKQSSDTVISALTSPNLVQPSGSGFLETCPVRTLRERKEDGTDIMLGDIGIHRCAFSGEANLDERTRLSKENADRKLGDPDIVWCIGYYIASSHFGRGIMTAALGALLHQWAGPRMGVRRLRVETFKGNLGSIRVFEKNGFILEKTIDQVETTNCGVSRQGTSVLWYTLENTS